MVVPPKVVSSLSILSVNEEYDVNTRNNSFGNVRDRSLSYLDVNVQRQSWRGFESVRKFGRPRQQISDGVEFADSTSKGDLGKHLNSTRHYHFGQCLLLPKISTLPPKGNCQKKCDSSISPANRIREKNEQQYFKNRDIAFCDFSQEVNLEDEIIQKSDNKMHRWTEITSDNYFKNASHKLSAEFHDSMNLRSRDQIESKIDFGDWEHEEDVEAQVSAKRRRDSEKSTDARDLYYYEHTNEEQLRVQDFDDITNPESKISDVRDNWRLTATKENEEKRLTAKHQTLQLVDNEIWIESTAKPIWTFLDENGKKQLHRSKSTPDMLEGTEKKNPETCIEKEQARRNRSTMNVYVRNSEAKKLSDDDLNVTLLWFYYTESFFKNSFKTAYANGSDYYCPSSNLYEKVYNDQQEADSLNDPISLQESVSSPETTGVGKFRNSRFSSGKNFFGQFLHSRDTTPTEMFANTEPFSQFWVTLSNIYGQTLVLLMLAFNLTEVMDNSVKLLSLQGIFLMYLYVGSIAVIICIYIWVLIDSCSSIQSNDGTGLVPSAVITGIVHHRDGDLENISTTKFGSLKKAHIARDRNSNTSFYLRIGAIAFGLGTLVFNGLEMAMHSMMESSCLNDVVFVHPILHGLFTFLQMHFLFVNSQVLVERFGLAARFGFMHLAATNLALWIRLIIWESGNEWTYYVHLSQNGHISSEIPTPLQLRGFPKFIIKQEREVYSGVSDNNLYEAISKGHISQVVSLHQCLNSNSLGQLWTSSMPFLYPFIIQFSIIAAAVTYIMGQNVAKDRLFFQKQKKTGADPKNHSLPALHNGLTAWNVDCNGASKGLFLGILCLVAGIVVIIIFLVVKENEDFPPETIFWLTAGTLLSILSVTIVMNVVGLVQVRKLSVVGTKLTPLDKILSGISILGVQLYAILGIIIGASGIAEESNEFTSSLQKRHGMLLAVSLIQLLQTTMQSTFVVEGIRRTTLSRTQALTKPARQVITFLIFSNAVLWAFDTFVIQSWLSQELQLRFFGILVWGVISRVALPLLVFYRFHSCVLLLEIWKKSYHSLHIDPGN